VHRFNCGSQTGCLRQVVSNLAIFDLHVHGGSLGQH
jgi:hypothetical protein